MADRAEAAESQVLDPTILSNVQFHHIKIKRNPAWAALGGSGTLRGRLQNMVPPTMADMPSPAPTVRVRLGGAR